MGDTGPVLPSCPQSCGGLSHGSGQVPLTQSAPPCWARGEVKLCGLDAPRPLDPSLPPRRLSSALCPALPPALAPARHGPSLPAPALGDKVPLSVRGPAPTPTACREAHVAARPAAVRSVRLIPHCVPAGTRLCGWAQDGAEVSAGGSRAAGRRGGRARPARSSSGVACALAPGPQDVTAKGEDGKDGRALPDGEVRGRCASGCQPRCSENSHRLLVPTARTWRRSHSHRPGTVPPHARPREPGPRDEAPRLRDVRVPRGGHSAALGGGGPWGPGLHAEWGKGWCPHGQKPLSEDRGDMGGATGQESEIRRTDV